MATWIARCSTNNKQVGTGYLHYGVKKWCLKVVVLYRSNISSGGITSSSVVVVEVVVVVVVVIVVEIVIVVVVVVWW
jgi:hypothetical protein